MVTPFLTAREVAQLMKVSVPTVFKYSHTGVLTSYRFGNTTRFKKEEIEKILQIKLTATTPLNHGQ